MRVLLTLCCLSAFLFLYTAFAEAAPAGRKSDAKGKSPKPANNKVAQRNREEAPSLNLSIAPVDPDIKEQVLISAEKIDLIIEKNLAKRGLEPNPPATDQQFVRRAYLDIVGAVPTGRQAWSFLKSDTPGKRSILVDHLLNQPGYASHFYNYWADVLRIVDKSGSNIYTRPFGEWLKQCLRENRPYDDMVHEMLTAEGKCWQNPAVGFKLRDEGMPLDNLNNTVRVFLGTRIGCAQCHDHPFDRWTQKEFYELAAFEGGVRTRAPRKGPQSVHVPDRVDDAVRQLPGKTGRRLRNLMRYNRYVVFEQTAADLKFPHDYAYDDAKPGQVAEPSVVFGELPALKPGESRRDAFANWLTSEDNPRFALTIANRLWKRAMGVGLIEPEDDIRDDTEAAIPELMDFLVEEMKRLDFNMKEFQRIIYHTRVYHRQVTYEGHDPTKTYYFPGPVLRRMTAEQVWDSLMTLSIKSPDAWLRPDDTSFVTALDAHKGTSVQALVSKGRTLVDAETTMRKEDRAQTYKGAILRRASEQAQPLPADHFLRQFGQSDRAIIADSSTEGTVPQLLTLFNGPVTHMMLEAGSVIHTEVMQADNVANRIRIIFLSVLGRMPDDDEMFTASSEIRNEGATGYGNVIWALLNTREFLFIQ